MRPDNKRLNRAWIKHSETNREELRLVCKKIAELETIWRLRALHKSVADEALDFRRLQAA